jgi:hypothetical protein
MPESESQKRARRDESFYRELLAELPANGLTTLKSLALSRGLKPSTLYARSGRLRADDNSRAPDRGRVPSACVAEEPPLRPVRVFTAACRDHRARRREDPRARRPGSGLIRLRGGPLKLSRVKNLPHAVALNRFAGRIRGSKLRRSSSCGLAAIATPEIDNPTEVAGHSKSPRRPCCVPVLSGTSGNLRHSPSFST